MSDAAGRPCPSSLVGRECVRGWHGEDKQEVMDLPMGDGSEAPPEIVAN